MTVKRAGDRGFKKSQDAEPGRIPGRNPYREGIFLWNARICAVAQKTVLQGNRPIQTGSS